MSIILSHSLYIICPGHKKRGGERDQMVYAVIILMDVCGQIFHWLEFGMLER